MPSSLFQLPQTCSLVIGRQVLSRIFINCIRLICSYDGYRHKDSSPGIHSPSFFLFYKFNIHVTDKDLNCPVLPRLVFVIPPTSKSTTHICEQPTYIFVLTFQAQPPTATIDTLLELPFAAPSHHRTLAPSHSTMSFQDKAQGYISQIDKEVSTR